MNSVPSQMIFFIRKTDKMLNSVAILFHSLNIPSDKIRSVNIIFQLVNFSRSMPSRECSSSENSTSKKQQEEVEKNAQR